MKNYCFANGKIVKMEEAQVPVNDLAVLRGVGVFDFFRTYNGIPFHLKDHYDRFCRSVKTLGFKIPISFQELEELVIVLLKKNKLKEASFRLVLTAGASVDGMTADQPSFFVLVEDLYELPKQIYIRGGKLITYEYSRFLPETKNTNYLTAISLMKRRLQSKAVEILYIINGQVFECSTSNIFLVKKGKLITPAEGILNGITRQVVIKVLAKNLGLKVDLKPIKTKELSQADEIFITATNKKIVPIVKIDEQTIANGCPGSITQALMIEFDNYLKL
ncbi:MAG: aminotransferase class IV [Patescibacteria group bacterium]